MHKIKIAMVAGFLGAGKTACILELAKELGRRGKRVSIVTCNQEGRPVDTEFLRREGLLVFEMPGEGFGRSFPEFVEKMTVLPDDQLPDIILAEPPGSCTGLIASVIRPLKKASAKRFDLAPLIVVADTVRVKRLMMETKDSPFPGEINCLFRKQMEEADIILLNKADLAEGDELDKMIEFLGNTFKEAKIFAVSAKKGKGITRCLPFILGNVQPEMGVVHMGCGIYGDAEDQLGRFTNSLVLYSLKELDFNTFALLFMDRLKKRFARRKCEIAHLKLFMDTGKDWAKVSLTGLAEDVDFYRKLEAKTKRVHMTVNALINMETDTLRTVMEKELTDLCNNWHVIIEETEMGSVKPDRPVKGKEEIKRLKVRNRWKSCV